MISAQTARRRPVAGSCYQTKTTEVHLRHLAGCVNTPAKTVTGSAGGTESPTHGVNLGGIPFSL